MCGPSDEGSLRAVAGSQGSIICPDPTTVCPEPSCFDGVLNADEVEVDCGGHCSQYCNVRAVGVVGTSFSPTELPAKRGDYVRWTWNTGLHNVVEANAPGVCQAASNPFTSGSPAAAGSYQLKFEHNGVFPYHCEVHCGGGMQG